MFPKLWQAWLCQHGLVLQNNFPLSEQEAFVDHRQRKLVVCPSSSEVLAIFIQTKKISQELMVH